MSQVHDLLRRVFGFTCFRGLQEQVVDHVVSGEDALVLMPTGGGKSLCYQIPAMARPGTGLVVSPLIALMGRPVSFSTISRKSGPLLALRTAAVATARIVSTFMMLHIWAQLRNAARERFMASGCSI